jgi:hypothetical protein
MSTRIIIITTLVMAAAVVGGLKWAGRQANRTNTVEVATGAPLPDTVVANEKFAQAEERLHEARSQLAAAEQRLNTAIARIRELEQRVAQMEDRRTGGRTNVPSGWDHSIFLSAERDVETGEPRRSWGPEQVTGAPDTVTAGDLPTAWASRLPDAGEEWLKLDYERTVEIAEVHVRETYNPGAVSKVTAIVGGREQTLWEGIEPVAPAPNDVTFSVPPGIRAGSIKIYLDTQRVAGWNEIDAVELVGRDGSRQWARRASASSTFAER